MLRWPQDPQSPARKHSLEILSAIFCHLLNLFLLPPVEHPQLCSWSHTAAEAGSLALWFHQCGEGVRIPSPYLLASNTHQGSALPACLPRQPLPSFSCSVYYLRLSLRMLTTCGLGQDLGHCISSKFCMCLWVSASSLD